MDAFGPESHQAQLPLLKLTPIPPGATIKRLREANGDRGVTGKNRHCSLPYPDNHSIGLIPRRTKGDH